MDIEEHIKSIVEKSLKDDSLFIVDIKSSGSANAHRKIIVLLDGDNGIDIDVCAQISRELGEELEVLEVIPNAYTLEVSSAGIDTPLTLPRQYQKNIGRRIKVDTTDNKSHQGELVEYTDEAILIKDEQKVKGKKKIEIAELSIKLSDINKTKVLVTFK